MTISPTQANVQEAVRDFLLAVFPSDTDVITAQANRVPEPTRSKFIVITPIRFERIETNLDGYADVRFTGSIAGGVMTVSNVAFGTLLVGASVYGSGVLPGTIIRSAGSAPGTWLVTPAQTVTSRELGAGAKTVQQNSKATVQLDFHSADTEAGDMAQTVATLFRDPYATGFFSALSAPLNSIAPLYADDPTQRPFINENQQYEWRWVLEAMLQVNQVLSVPQQFADSASVDLVSVDASYPP